jgi:phosphoglycerate dehydrogenase-like enzyme
MVPRCSPRCATTISQALDWMWRGRNRSTRTTGFTENVGITRHIGGVTHESYASIADASASSAARLCNSPP